MGTIGSDRLNPRRRSPKPRLVLKEIRMRNRLKTVLFPPNIQTESETKRVYAVEAKKTPHSRKTKT